jgi:hypothetical protein
MLGSTRALGVVSVGTMATDSIGGTSSGEAAASDALRRWYDAWNAHDVEAISALMTDDVRYEDPSAPADVMNGRPAVEEYVRAAFAAIPDLRLEKLEEWVSPGGEVICSYFRFSGTFRAPLTAPRSTAAGADRRTPRNPRDGSQRSP